MVEAVPERARNGHAAASRVIAPYLFGRPVIGEVLDEKSDLRGPLVSIETDHVGPGGTVIQPEDADWPEELERLRHERQRE